MPHRPKAWLAGSLAAAAALCAAGWSDARDLGGRRTELQRETRVIARLVATRIQGGLENHLTAMRQMANFFASSRKVNERSFLAYAAKTLSISPACLNLAFVGPDLTVERSYPPDTGRWKKAFDPIGRAPAYDAVLRASRTLHPVVSPPMPLSGGATGFVLAEPVVADRRLRGTLVGACRSQEYFDSLLVPEVTERYEQMVLDSEAPIFSTDAAVAGEAGVPPVSERFVFGGADWEVRVRPQERVVHDRLAAGRALFWVMAVVFSLAFGALAAAATLWAGGMSERLRSQGAALVEARTRLDGAREQLVKAERLTALGQLVAGVAHEINNPLAGVVGYTQLLMKRRFSAPVQRKLETIAAEGARMAKIVRNLLTFARKHAPEKVVTSLNEVIEQTLAIKAYHLRANQIKVVKELDPGLPPTLIDVHQMQQVLINLLNNAEQAMLEARHGHTIRVTTSVVEGRIRMRVSDDGPGIPAEIRERVLEPFFTTKTEGKGTGLGLSICNGIVQEHGGGIRVESPPGEGATFVVDLPVQTTSTATEPGVRPHEAPSAPPLNVLIIDDETSVQEFLADLLALDGHGVDTASDVPEAVQKILAGGHDLIIADLKMPSGTARDIYTAVLQAQPQLARRIVFTTGQIMSDEMVDFLKTTGNELIFKPFDLEAIESAVARAARN